MHRVSSTKSFPPSELAWQLGGARFFAALVFTLVCGCSGGGGSSASAPEPVTAAPSAPPSSTPPSPNVATEQGVVYGTGDTDSGAQELLLDIYQPDGACTEPRPFVVGIHGGGFVGGSRSDSNWVANMEAVTGRGFAGLSIDYRLAGDGPVPSSTYQPVVDDLMLEAERLGLTSEQREVLNASVAAMEDTVKALEWAVANAEERCLDPDRFALWGSSAGAITALHVSHALDDYFIVRPEPLVVIDYWGRLFLEGQVSTHGPPMMIVHGTADETVIYEETALVLAAEAEAAFLPFTFYIIEGGPHGFGSVNPARVQINGESPLVITLNFIEDHLKDLSPVYETQTIVPQG